MNVTAARPTRGDLLVALPFLVLGQLVTWLRLDSVDAFAGSRPSNAILVALGTAPLVWRRVTPLGALVAGAVVLCLPRLVVDMDLTVLGTALPLIALTASCGYHASPRRTVIGAAVGVLGLLTVTSTSPVLSTPTSVIFNGLMMLAPWGAARALRHREERARRLGADLARERAARQVQLATVVQEERARIARDLHDIVAHGVSVMVVQVGGARMQMVQDPAEAARSLLNAEEAGRHALADLRTMLDVLRADASLGETTGHEPRPGLGHLARLVKQVAGAGVMVEAHVTGSVTDLPPAIDVSAYRIVQEALTNVIKHSRAENARVCIGRTARELTVSVRDDGPPRRAQGDDGHGLVGVRERVALFGGCVRTGSTPAGGWDVVVTIPLDPAASSQSASRVVVS